MGYRKEYLFCKILSVLFKCKFVLQIPLSARGTTGPIPHCILCREATGIFSMATVDPLKWLREDSACSFKGIHAFSWCRSEDPCSLLKVSVAFKDLLAVPAALS